jgi:hypothetical protein
MGARRFLPLGHYLRRNIYNKFFNGALERRNAPERPNGRFWSQQWQRVKDGEVPLKKSGMTQLAGFHHLPYFKV